MPSPLSIGTRDIPLRLAKEISNQVNLLWANGGFLNQVTPITQELLKFWFSDPYTDRSINFNEGQRQAILNVIYLHEILKTKSVLDIYNLIDKNLLFEIDTTEITKEKYNIPKYAVKMATGTGKTWVMHALLIWQYLNAKYEQSLSNEYTKNFLFVAPGLIVYERLLDAYLGKENSDGVRNFETSDFFKFKDLFIPTIYREDIFGFIQNGVSKKEDIGRKVTGGGLIAMTNWQLFLDHEEKNNVNQNSTLDDPSLVANSILSLQPGTSGGNDLNYLDNNYLRGREFEFLCGLKNLMVFNDEAHHIHENKSYGEVKEVEWQKSLNELSYSKNRQFIQVDFSATPYDVTGSGQKRVKHYFPYIVIDFDLTHAIKQGLVKMIAIDKRAEPTDINLDFRAIKGKEETILSEGQKLMIRAGLAKLNILEKGFVGFTKSVDGVSHKYPKMMIMCENTTVSPKVVDFLKTEGLSDEDILRVDSDSKGNIPANDWQTLKQKLFNIDDYEKPKIIVSVLMLREGFDVNNVCVVVPLRASQAPILLEQTIGRGLRLMWREPEYQDIKMENRKLVLNDKREPNSYLDILYVIEHPAFIQFYEDIGKLMDDGSISETSGNLDNKSMMGDMITIGLKSNYKEYDLIWPVITKDREETIDEITLAIQTLHEFTSFSLDQLRQAINKKGEQFRSEEITVKTNFGTYTVNANLFNAQSYNEYLAKVLNIVTNRTVKISSRKTKNFPVIQTNHTIIIDIIDKYIREKLFNQSFDPFKDNNWKILLLKNGIVTQHIVQEIGIAIYNLEKNININEAQVNKTWFSSVTQLKMRGSCSLEIQKTIYQKLKYPSNKGGLEKDFMLYADKDGEVESLMKIDENEHTFASIRYIRNDGLMATYHPDFLIKTINKIYIIETKADKDLTDVNVQKKRLAILDWVKNINQLAADDRMGRKWEYVLLGESHFYGLQQNNASITEICELAKVSVPNIEGKLL